MKYNEYVENAIEWAKRYIGLAEYKFLCLGFVEDCYEQSNNVEILVETLQKNLRIYIRSKRIRRLRLPLVLSFFMIVAAILMAFIKIGGMLGFV